MNTHHTYTRLQKNNRRLPKWTVIDCSCTQLRGESSNLYGGRFLNLIHITIRYPVQAKQKSQEVT